MPLPLLLQFLFLERVQKPVCVNECEELFMADLARWYFWWIMSKCLYFKAEGTWRKYVCLSNAAQAKGRLQLVWGFQRLRKCWKSFLNCEMSGERVKRGLHRAPSGKINLYHQLWLYSRQLSLWSCTVRFDKKYIPSSSSHHNSSWYHWL